MTTDIRHAARALRRSPGFTVTAIATLAVGIGVNAAVFTVTNAVLLKGFTLVDENDRILYIASRGQGYAPFVSYPDFDDWREQARSFEGMGAVNALRLSLSDGNGFPETCDGTQVSANTFALLGQRPMIGRDFTASDEVPGAAPVAILSYPFWERRYGKDPAVIGRTIRLDGFPATVVGVMAQGFAFPRAQDLWVPLVPTPDLQKREARELWFAFGRMRDDVTFEAARAEMEAIGRRLAAAYPRTNQSLVPAVHRFDEFFTGSNAATIYQSMLGAVGFVVLIACANLANLLLGRAMGRSREMSVRLALGAGRWRIARQLLIESLMLAAAGGVLGWLMAGWGVRAYEIAAGPPSWFERQLDYAMDHRVLAYLIVMSIGTGLLFGLAPVSRLSRLDINATLKDGGGASGRHGTRLSTLLVIGEMALALVLLAGAGVMIRSVLNLHAADLGVEARHVLAGFVELPDVRYASAEARIAVFDRLASRLRAIPSVESIAIADRVPTQGARRLPYELAGAAPVDAQHRSRLSALVIGPAYFQTLGAAIRSGREFDDIDGASSPPVIIVNQRFASDAWPGEDPIGKRLRVFDGTVSDVWLTVVGVASNIVQRDITQQTFDPLVYLPYRQRPAASMWVFARAGVPPGSLATAFRREVQALDADLPVFHASALVDHLAEGYRNNELFGGLFLTFAAIALLLASIGLYAVIAHSLSQRTREIGIRTAMGATARDMVALVLWQGMCPVGIGLVVGVAVALAVMPLLRSVLVQVSPADPIAFVSASLVLIVVAALGCLVPARRAARVDPLVALRHE